jgi:hypothetical protein
MFEVGHVFVTTCYFIPVSFHTRSIKQVLESLHQILALDWSTQPKLNRTFGSTCVAEITTPIRPSHFRRKRRRRPEKKGCSGTILTSHSRPCLYTAAHVILSEPWANNFKRATFFHIPSAVSNPLVSAGLASSGWRAATAVFFLLFARKRVSYLFTSEALEVDKKMHPGGPVR